MIFTHLPNLFSHRPHHWLNPLDINMRSGELNDRFQQPVGLFFSSPPVGIL